MSVEATVEQEKYDEERIIKQLWNNAELRPLLVVRYLAEDLVGLLEPAPARAQGTPAAAPEADARAQPAVFADAAAARAEASMEKLAGVVRSDAEAEAELKLKLTAAWLKAMVLLWHLRGSGDASSWAQWQFGFAKSGSAYDRAFLTQRNQLSESPQMEGMKVLFGITPWVKMGQRPIWLGGVWLSQNGLSL